MARKNDPTQRPPDPYPRAERWRPAPAALGGCLFAAVMGGWLVAGLILAITVPRFEQVFQDFDAELPVLTGLVISLSHAARNPLVWGLGLMLMVGWAALYAKVDSWAIRVPLIALPLALLAGVVLTVLAGLFIPLLTLTRSIDAAP